MKKEGTVLFLNAQGQKIKTGVIFKINIFIYFFVFEFRKKNTLKSKINFIV